MNIPNPNTRRFYDLRNFHYKTSLTNTLQDYHLLWFPHSRGN